MGKDKLDNFIKRETQGPSISQAVTGAAITGILLGTAKALGCIFNSKQ